MIKSNPMVFSLLILIPAVESQFGSFAECYDGIYCSEDLEFIIPNKECSKSTFIKYSYDLKPLTISFILFSLQLCHWQIWMQRLPGCQPGKSNNQLLKWKMCIKRDKSRCCLLFLDPSTHKWRYNRDRTRKNNYGMPSKKSCERSFLIKEWFNILFWVFWIIFWQSVILGSNY